MRAEKLQLWKQDKKGSKKEGKRKKSKKNRKVFISNQLLVSKKHLCFLFSPRWERAQNDASDSNQGLGFQTLSSFHLSMREGWRGDIRHISALHVLSRLRNIPRSQMTTSAFSLVINTMSLRQTGHVTSGLLLTSRWWRHCILRYLSSQSKGIPSVSQADYQIGLSSARGRVSENKGATNALTSLVLTEISGWGNIQIVPFAISFIHDFN